MRPDVRRVDQDGHADLLELLARTDATDFEDLQATQ